MPAPQPASRYISQPASRIVLPPSAVPLRILRNQSIVSAGLFYTIGKFISYRIKKDAPLWMRTQRAGNPRLPGNYCLMAIALGASVRLGAHFL